MKCVKIVEEKKLEVCETEEPISKNGSVVFKVTACGICGSDIHYWEVGEPKGLIMGHEFAGTVIDPGSRSDLKAGDRITGLPISPCGYCNACKSGNPQYCKLTWSKAVGLSLSNNGGYAEVSSCRSDLVKKLPDNVTDEEAAMVEPSAVSLHAVNLGNIKKGDNVLVIGGGIIGLMCAEFAKLQGAKNVTLLETNDERGKKALGYGKVDEYYNALDEKIIPELIKKTIGGFDVVMECCGNSPAVSEAIMAVKPGGKIVLVGVALGNVNIPLVMSVMGEVTLQGAIAYTPQEFENVIDMISKKEIDVKKYIDDIVSLDRVQESFIRLTSGKDSAIKIIIKP
ncbi:MAG: alcohol dehydrogenase catalytic domain-containing protein [Bacilli bacterium]|nr:alcohol dehydrogenase catalytic domain-containing protein [Bacilli bacterium]